MFYRPVKGTRWYDRGDVAAYDYTVATLTADGAWHDLDISGIVGAARRLVLINTYLKDNAGGKMLSLKTKGNVNGINIEECSTVVADKTCSRNAWLYTDTNGVLQYNIEVATWANTDLAIRGYFK